MKTIIFGAGKIARGFIGHLLWKGNNPFQFVDYNQELVNLLHARKSYSVRILGEVVTVDSVSGFDAWSYENSEEIITAIATYTTTIFISVGGKNLSSVGELLRKALLRRHEAHNHAVLNIVLCENWIKPADIVANRIKTDVLPDFLQFLDSYVGISEAVVMRSAIEPTPEVLAADPLAVNVQDFWYFPVDDSRLKGKLPDIPGINYIDDFGGYLDRKFYTYNAANGTVSYLGYLKGYRHISDAAKDPDILAILEMVYRETGRALCSKHGFNFKDHMKFTRTSLEKLQNSFIVDYVERNARDPIRKLGPTDRLVGPARMVMAYGGVPDALATSIAAAIHYDEPSDPIAVQLKALREVHGIPYILENICRLSSDELDLAHLVLEKVELLKSWGWIK
jgi:mannitol-1-phosphate 5-dehydrogenase